MHVRVKLFAILRERAGTSELLLDLPDGANVSSAIAETSRSIPAIAPFLARSAPAVNLSYAAPSTVLRDGDELALIPPVSGGAA